ncbi:hypothetical protein ABFA07_009132 [Porites harrisoni]
MLMPFVFFSMFLIQSTHGTPISKQRSAMTVQDDPSLSATEIIDKINEVEDVEPGLYEGDILLDKDRPSDDDLRQRRNARRRRHYIWKKKIIPYVIDSQLVSEGYGSTIQAAVDQFAQHTCITWKPRENEERWVTFVKKSGCYSSVGVHYWKTGSQDISLGNGCNHQGVIMHEMMHAAGFWHEQSRYDRDQYVEIMWENIQPGKEHNFDKYNLNEIDYLSEVYDTESIMHYGKISFSTNGQPTIQALGNPDKQLGQRNGFSKTDIAQLNALYDCSGPSGGWSGWTDFGPCDSQCYHSRQRFCASHDLANCPGADYYGVETETEKCPDEKCYAPLDGHWGRWSAWSSCSVTCDTGTYKRTRKCDDPEPKNNGKDCEGQSQQVGQCVMQRCGLGPLDCEFEAGGLCHWTICNPSNYPRWYYHRGPTGSSGTGPNGDHTSGSGNYMYFEASSPAQQGQTNCFYSKDLAVESCRSLTFWYHMLGSGIGALRVKLQFNDSTLSTIWEKKGEQGNQWIQASVEIKEDSQYKVYFEGERGGDFRGDISVDDIAFKKCPEPTQATQQPTTTQAPTTTKQPTTTQAPTTTKQPTTTQTPTSTLPPTTSSVVLDSCDFDGSSMCDWTNRPSNSYDWQLNKGATLSSNTGPANDHTSGQGSYIYLNAANQLSGHRGELISKQFPGDTAKCLQFWYHMYGNGMGSFRVFITRGKKGRRWELFRKVGNRGSNWQYKGVNVKKHKRNRPFKLIFEGTRGDNAQGDIALDDVKLVEGPC